MGGWVGGLGKSDVVVLCLGEKSTEASVCLLHLSGSKGETR